MSVAPTGSGTPCCVIGAGRIGGAIAESLLRAGHPVSVFDSDSAATDPARGLGATVATTAASAAEGAELVFVAVPDSPQIFAAVEGADGLERGLGKGSVLAVMSTVDPGTTIELARRLERGGVEVIDAPLSGGPDRARSGRLTLMVGGSETTVERCLPVLEALADHVVHVGPVGHGEVAKLVNNLMGAVIAIAITEGLTLAARSGADLARVTEAVATASGGSWILSEWMPSTALAGDHTARFALNLMDKDLELIGRLADGLGVPIPACELAHRIFRRAIDAGHGDADFSIVAELHALAAGTTLAPADLAAAGDSDNNDLRTGGDGEN